MKKADAGDQIVDIRIVRSARRRKTVGARLIDENTLEVRAPEDIPDAELATIIETLKRRIRKRLEKHPRLVSDEDLERRAQRLNQELFGGALRWQSIRFVSNQKKRFGSCTPARGTLRISDRLVGAPAFVLDYVLVHELAHLIEPHHNQAFWDLVYRFPLTERARGYLMALDIEGDAVGSGGAID
jgi:predicted metal-dependent hydrolase